MITPWLALVGWLGSRAPLCKLASCKEVLTHPSESHSAALLEKNERGDDRAGRNGSYHVKGHVSSGTGFRRQYPHSRVSVLFSARVPVEWPLGQRAPPHPNPKQQCNWLKASLHRWKDGSCSTPAPHFRRTQMYIERISKEQQICQLVSWRTDLYGSVMLLLGKLQCCLFFLRKGCFFLNVWCNTYDATHMMQRIWCNTYCMFSVMCPHGDEGPRHRLHLVQLCCFRRIWNVHHNHQCAFMCHDILLVFYWNVMMCIVSNL